MIRRTFLKWCGSIIAFLGFGVTVKAAPKPKKDDLVKDQIRYNLTKNPFYAKRIYVETRCWQCKEVIEQMQGFAGEPFNSHLPELNGFCNDKCADAFYNSKETK